jgi:hypothetical protein
VSVHKFGLPGVAALSWLVEGVLLTNVPTGRAGVIDHDARDPLRGERHPEGDHESAK